MIRYECDGCKSPRSLSYDELHKSALAVRAYLEQHPEAQGDAKQLDTVFCSTCVQHADSYWAGKILVYRAAVNELANRINAHHRRFWNDALKTKKAG